MLGTVFMKILEGRPRSYDQAMDRLSAGRVRAVKEALAALVRPGAQVLEMGCGTGELASLLLRAGAARVAGFDQSPAMAAACRARIAEEGLAARFTVERMGVEDMDRLPAESFDEAYATFLLSELSDDARRFALAQAFRVLRPGGRVAVADEALPRKPGPRAFYQLARAPLLAAAYLITGSITRPLSDPRGDLTAAGFTAVREDRRRGWAFTVATGRKPAAP